MTDVLIPVSHLDSAKTRLEPLLTLEQRQQLVITCVRLALDATREAGFHPALITGDPRVAALAGPGVTVLRESAAVSNLNEAIAEGLATLPVDSPAVILHADIPLVSATSLLGLVRNAQEPPSAVIAPSANGGTNALYLNPRGQFVPAYGHGSVGRHATALESAGVSVRYLADPTLALDLDFPDDIWQLLRSPGPGDNPAVDLLNTFGLTPPRINS